MTSIIPISSALSGPTQVGGGPNKALSGAADPKPFSDYLKNAVDNIEQLDAVKTENAYALAVGDIDDIAAVNTSAQKYEIAIQLMVQMRNKLLDSYSEIMRMNI